jgi:RNA polymerase sigma factor (sigma-70 family)
LRRRYDPLLTRAESSVISAFTSWNLPASCGVIRSRAVPRCRCPGAQGPEDELQGRGSALDDDQAIALSLRGDLDAYGVLVARYSALARRTALFAGAGEDSDDVVQEAFVKGFRKLGSFRGEAFRPWLLRIVVNESRNLHRSFGRRRALVTRAASVFVDVVCDPEDEAVVNERKRELLAAVRALPEKDRMVLACRYFLELGEAETAEVLGWPLGSVKSRTSRALAKLRDQLGPIAREEVAGA